MCMDSRKLSYLSDYLSYRKQRAKVGSAYSNWANVIRGIPKVSMLGGIFTFQYLY